MIKEHLKAHFDDEKKEEKWIFLINCGASVHFFTKKYTKLPYDRTIIDWKETNLTNNDCFFMNGCELQHGFVGLRLTKEFPYRIGFSVRKRILPLSTMIEKPYFYKKQLQSQPRWENEDYTYSDPQNCPTFVENQVKIGITFFLHDQNLRNLKHWSNMLFLIIFQNIGRKYFFLVKLKIFETELQNGTILRPF